LTGHAKIENMKIYLDLPMPHCAECGQALTIIQVTKSRVVAAHGEGWPANCSNGGKMVELRRDVTEAAEI
jgi:hypothetical protein